jgi:hypothetical protein
MPYLPENDGKAIIETVMRKQYPKTYEYFQNFRNVMLKRPHYLQHFKAGNAPYWSMYNVGNYSFAPARVVWREQTTSFRCAVVETALTRSRSPTQSSSWFHAYAPTKRTTWLLSSTLRQPDT